MAKNNIINVRLFGKEIGRIDLNAHENKTSFQYNPEFIKKGALLNIFPATGIIKRIPQVQIFSQFNNETFKSLPPQFADSLPDMYGNLIFKTWLESNDNTQKEISIIEQLAYVSNRGMGALEYFPANKIPKNTTIDLDEIIEILKLVMYQKQKITENKFNSKALLNIFKVGTSAGGARPKIIISKHKQTGKIIPGDIEYSNDYEHYLVKLSLDDETVYQREIVEYCYYLTARELGITMMDSKLIDNKHFSTKRYDRQNGEKQHVLTASGITGWDFKKPENSSYENLFNLSSYLKIPRIQIEELFKRMIFNVIFRNVDDHLKNHSFIYNKRDDSWSLSPAYDLTYSLNPLLDFKKVNRALSINNKRNNINLSDVLKIADAHTIKNPKGIIKNVQNAVQSLNNNMNKFNIPIKIRENILRKMNRLI